MAECIIEEKPVVKSEEVRKLEDFDLAINMSDRFSIEGITEDETKFVLKDALKQDGVEGRYIELDIKSVISCPLKSIMDVLEKGRADEICKGYTRIVGYYSSINNWNSSKIGELRDRASGDYGTPKYKPDFQNERIAFINNH